MKLVQKVIFGEVTTDETLCKLKNSVEDSRQDALDAHHSEGRHFRLEWEKQGILWLANN